MAHGYANIEVDNCQFFAAVRKQCVQTVTKLLDHGGNPNTQNTKGNTPLMEATRHRARDLASVLLSRSADPNIQNCDRDTALIIAAKRSFLDIVVEILVTNKADVNLANANGNTALMEATKADSVGVFTSLLKVGAAVNAQARDGQTALMIATRVGSEHKVDTLLTHGADVNIARSDGDTALILAARKCPERMVRSILHAHADVNRQNLRGDTALIEATRRLAIKITSVLFGFDADANIQNLNGDTALTIAVGMGQEELVKFLIVNGADVNLQTNAGHNALSTVMHELAISRRRRDRTIQEDHDLLNVLDILLDFGALPDTADPHSCSILHVLASRGMLERMHSLIQQGYGPLDVDTNMSYLGRDTQIRLALPKLSPFLGAILFGQVAIADYLSDLNFFTETDIEIFWNTKIRQTLRCLLHKKKQHLTLSFLDALLAAPWSLFRLCFVQLSLTLGGEACRKERVEDTIPCWGRLQEKLCFDETLGRGL